MKRRHVVLSSASLLLGAAPRRAAAQTLNGFDVRGALIPIKAIEQGGPPRDGIPSIDKPRFVEAARGGLKDNGRVLALARNGVARAYPVRILN